MNYYKMYEQYKESGIEWIVDIPEHWEVRKFGYLFSFDRGLSITKDNLRDSGIPCVSYGEIHSKYRFEVNPDIHELKCVDEDYLSSNKKSLIKRGDFVFADTSEDVEGSGNFTLLNSDNIVFAGYHTIIARLIYSHNCRYLAYLFESLPFRSQIRCQVSGIKVFSITQTILKKTKVILPPLKEQQAIANFLDHITSEIDGLIYDKEKLIELLQEKRQAIISEAVTRGLNPDVKMNDSGIEWIGEIPEHWSLMKIKYLMSMEGGFAFSASDFQEDGVQLIKIANLYKNELSLDRQPSYLPMEFLITHKNFVVTKGDILISLTGTLGKRDYGYAILLENDEEFLLNQRVGKLKCSDKLITKYGLYILQSQTYLNQLFSLPSGTKQGNLSNEQVLSVKMPITLNKNEQEKIVNHIDSKICEINSLIISIENQIDKLKEYRQSLISEAVTGKIDLREYSA